MKPITFCIASAKNEKVYTKGSGTRKVKFIDV